MFFVTGLLGSLFLFELVLDIYISTTYQTESVSIVHLITYLENLNEDKQFKTLLLLKENALDNTKYNCIQRFKLVKEILTFSLKNCKYSVLENFYSCIMEDFLELLHQSNDYSKEALVNKSIGFILLEVLFSRINLQKLQSNECILMKKALKKDMTTEKEFLQFFTKFCLESRSVCIECDQDLKYFYRTYHCQSYNALISIIANTKKEVDIYPMLFGHFKNDTDVLWKNMIDLDKTYEFPIDFEEIPRRRKLLLNIRSEILKKSNNENVQTATYIESQVLFNSTLKEDVCKYDFNNSIIKRQTNNINDCNDSNKNLQIEPLEIELENVEINNHECMSSVCGLIEHMVKNNIHTVEEENKNVVLPKWMIYLRKILIDTNSHRNVRLFITKIIENMQYVFKPYAKYYIDPIMKLIVDGCCGENLNFYICDLVSTYFNLFFNISSDKGNIKPKNYIFVSSMLV